VKNIKSIKQQQNADYVNNPQKLMEISQKHYKRFANLKSVSRELLIYVILNLNVDIFVRD
jgi:hypothetical protein